MIRSRLSLLLLLVGVTLAGCVSRPSCCGWTSLFDGKTLEGWVTTGGRYDGKARWTVEDGAIVGREGANHAGGLLYTKDAYRDVDIVLDVWISHPFDSGIFFRMRPKGKGAQVTLDYRPEGEIAGIYADGWWHHNEGAKQRWRKDRWNRVRTRCTGDPMHITVWLNGAEVTDYIFPKDAFGFAKEGLIGLQVHGSRGDPPDSKVMFRNILIRPIP